MAVLFMMMRFNIALLAFCIAACSPHWSQNAGRRVEEAPIRVGGKVRAPVLIRRIEPACTETPGDPRAEATVETIVEKDGRIRDVKIVKGQRSAFVVAAEQSLRTWEFYPGTLNGQPVLVILTFRIRGCWLSPPISDVRLPVLVKRIEPTCPQTTDDPGARSTIEAIVERDGRIREVTVVEGKRSTYVVAAEQALRSWDFLPGTLNDNPVPVTLIFHVQGCWLSPPVEPPQDAVFHDRRY